jgi:glutathione peroxidase
MAVLSLLSLLASIVALPLFMAIPAPTAHAVATTMVMGGMTHRTEVRVDLLPTPSDPVEVNAGEAVDQGPILSRTVTDIEGKPVKLGEAYAGKVLLIVNVASKCGQTKQYKPLMELHNKYADKGLVILGFPCNQFGGQEPGTEEDIQAFCKDRYDVKFPMFSKIDVNGDKADGLYQHLTGPSVTVEDRGPVKWNFEKFLVDRSGKVIARFRTKVQPDDPAVIAAIEQALGGK